MSEQFGHKIWIADGSEVAVIGFHYPTRMAVIRLSGGRLSGGRLSTELAVVLKSEGIS
jgi:hypothetical protein